MSEHSNQKRKAIIVAVILILVVVLAGAWYLFIYKPEQEAKEKARLEQVAKKKAKKEREELVAQQKAKYKKLIEDADEEFGQENLEMANSLYSEASSLFPKEEYPQDQMALLQPKLDRLAALEANKAAGIIEIVNLPTGRFHVIVSSSIDDDLAMDYAKKLTKEGNNVKIIGPSGPDNLYHRLSVAEYDTREEAETASTSFSTYGEGVWVLKF